MTVIRETMEEEKREEKRENVCVFDHNLLVNSSVRLPTITESDTIRSQNRPVVKVYSFDHRNH